MGDNVFDTLGLAITSLGPLIGLTSKGHTAISNDTVFGDIVENGRANIRLDLTRTRKCR